MNKIEFGNNIDILRKWKAEGVKVQTCVTSPPYFGLRSYLPDESPDKSLEIGLEQTPDEYISKMVEVFRAVKDVLTDDGTLWVNIGDSYGKGKQLLGIPWKLAFALQSDGWILRQDIIWHKPNPMPESVSDRCTKSHEYIFLLSKSEKYFFDNVAIKETAIHSNRTAGNKNHQKGYGKDKMEIRGGLLAAQQKVYETRNKRSVWTVATKPYKGAHFATFPITLVEPCILAGSHQNDIVLDPFMGSGTTAEVALMHDRKFLGCELNTEYKNLQDERIARVLQTKSTISLDI